jgi:predicted dehydrogenase
MTDPIRIAIIGTAKRSSYLYGPLLKAIPGIELVSVWGRTAEKANTLTENLGVPAYTDLDKLVRETAPQIGIVDVAYSANGEVGLMAVEAGLNVLLETPIAHKLSEADAIIAAAEKRGLKIEVSEQFHRRPLEQIKLKLLASGIFGKVHSSFSDFAGHGYHGISVMRSYLGFEAKPLQVSGSVHDYPLGAHWSRLGDSRGERSETQEHALITIERRWERVDGGALVGMYAHTGDPQQPVVSWENPFQPAVQGQGPQWHDDEIGVAGCILSLVNAVRNNTQPTYGPYQARLDQELILAIRQSALEGGRPVRLPLDPAAQEI